jgi:hypothetical protein
VSPPHVVNGDVIYGGATDTNPWERYPNPWAGVEDLRWFHENQRQLTAYQDRWIAILRQGVVASGLSMREVRDQVVAQRFYDALIVHVPEDVTRREYFIG